MPMIAILLMSSVMIVIAVIGLADGLAHLLSWMARSVRVALVGRAARRPTKAARPANRVKQFTLSSRTSA